MIKATGTTINILPNDKKKATKYSKRNISKVPIETEDSSDDEYMPSREDTEKTTQQSSGSESVVEIFPPRDNSPQKANSLQNVNSPEKTAKKQDEAMQVKEERKEEEESTPKKAPIKFKVQRKKEKRTKKRETVRRRVPTRRYGIDEAMDIEETEAENPFAIWNKKN